MMIAARLGAVCLLLAGPAAAQPPKDFDVAAAARFAALALDCVHKEYPNKIAHVLGSDQDVRPPRELTPAFIAAEVRYLHGAGRVAFERPYGLAWLLQLAAELREWNDPQARQWSRTLEPLEAAAANRIREWLPKLTRPIRIGEHDQTAFAFGLILDWARTAGDTAMLSLLSERSTAFYLGDKGCPMSYEPSGQDFLSPCLGEADLVRRILPSGPFGSWLKAFLPGIPTDGSATWLEPAAVSDPGDPKLAHLDGLNLSRAWMLEGIAAGLTQNDSRIPALRAAARRHREAGLRSVTGAHYEGGHWLGSFAVYLVTGRGLRLE